MWRLIIIGIIVGIIINTLSTIGKINNNIQYLQDQISGVANAQDTIQSNINSLDLQCTASTDGVPGDMDCTQQQ